jgi:hypothetical protein
MKYALGSLLLAGGLALSIDTAKADPLTLTSPQRKREPARPTRRLPKPPQP